MIFKTVFIAAGNGKRPYNDVITLHCTGMGTQKTPVQTEIEKGLDMKTYRTALITPFQ